MSAKSHAALSVISDQPARLALDPYAFSGGRNATLRYIARVMPYMQGRRHVLDLGCGHGYLMDELRQAGVNSTGVDQSESVIVDLRDRDHEAFVDNAHRFLEKVDLASYDVIAILHLIEHFDAPEQIRLIELAAQKLPLSGRLIIITPNFRNPAVARENFWLDPTHVRPMPLPLMDELLKAAGLTVIASGNTWPWDRSRFLGQMRQSGHSVHKRTKRETLGVLQAYVRKVIAFGPQLSLLRGDSFIVADKR